jgi:hypothetical protein
MDQVVTARRSPADRGLGLGSEQLIGLGRLNLGIVLKIVLPL